jgi:hypothetical protein
MRTITVLVASTHICLVACQPTPGNLLLSSSGPDAKSALATAPSKVSAPQPDALKPTPHMRCVNDFWGNCTGVVSSRHKYRWRYVRPGARPKELRESAAARANVEETGPIQKAVLRDAAPPVRQDVVLRVPAPPQKAVPAGEKVAGKAAPEGKDRKAAAERNAAPERKTAQAQAPARQRTVMVGGGSRACQPRRRVVGDEKPSQDDARRAAEDGWMGAVRYDYGERYQDINIAKDVRLHCGPSSVSKALKTPHFRCAVEATPCRQTEGTPMEPDERRYEPKTQESQISRR